MSRSRYVILEPDKPHFLTCNLMYEDTVETDVYRALRTRIQLFTAVVGRLQPILSALPAQIARVALATPGEQQQARANLVSQLQQEASATAVEAFDIDEAIEATLDMPTRPPAPYGLDELGRLLDHPKLLPPGVEARRVSSKDVFWSQPGAQQVSVTTDVEFYEEHPKTVEFWTPGSPAFPHPVGAGSSTSDMVPIRELLKVL